LDQLEQERQFETARISELLQEEETRLATLIRENNLAQERRQDEMVRLRIDNGNLKLRISSCRHWFFLSRALFATGLFSSITFLATVNIQTNNQINQLYNSTF
jgi:hypothetical protein